MADVGIRDSAERLIKRSGPCREFTPRAAEVADVEESLRDQRPDRVKRLLLHLRGGGVGIIVGDLGVHIVEMNPVIQAAHQQFLSRVTHRQSVWGWAAAGRHVDGGSDYPQLVPNHADLRRLVDKLWSYCDVLRDAGVSNIDYVEQLS